MDSFRHWVNASGRRAPLFLVVMLPVVVALARVRDVILFAGVRALWPQAIGATYSRMASISIQKPKRTWRTVFAVLISFALVLSFFHGWSLDADGGIVTVAMAQPGCDGSGKAVPDAAAPHGDHCLTHVTTVTPQDSAVAIEYVTQPYRLAAGPMLEPADPASPFKPPRA